MTLFVAFEPPSPLKAYQCKHGQGCRLLGDALVLNLEATSSKNAAALKALLDPVCDFLKTGPRSFFVDDWKQWHKLLTEWTNARWAFDSDVFCLFFPPSSLFSSLFIRLFFFFKVSLLLAMLAFFSSAIPRSYAVRYDVLCCTIRCARHSQLHTPPLLLCTNSTAKSHSPVGTFFAQVWIIQAPKVGKRTHVCH